jgi:hypothetical protein
MEKGEFFKMIKKVFLIILFSFFLFSSADAVTTFPDPALLVNGAPITRQYGDAYSYSLPYLNALIDLGALPGYAPNAFSIQSAPGQIKDGSIVIYTGAGGTGDIYTNFPGMDNAMPAVSGNGAGNTRFDSSINYAGAVDLINGTWDRPGSWDSSLSAFVNALTTTANPAPTNSVFLFNNNQTNSGGSADQSLFAYSRITFTGSGKNDIVYEFIGKQTPGGPYDFVWDGGEPDPWNSRSDPGEFGYVQGEVVFPAPIGALDHNLGANEVAYAVYFPEINLQQLLALGYDELHGDFRMRDLNNGFEQLFILQDFMEFTPPPPPPPPVTEPGTVILLGFGLISLAIYSRRELKDKKFKS